MAHVEGEIIIRRPIEDVFDFVADQRNEPRYNRRMVRAEKISSEREIWGDLKRQLERGDVV